MENRQIGWLNTGSGAIAIGDAFYLAAAFDIPEENGARSKALNGGGSIPYVAPLHFDPARDREQRIELVWPDGSLNDAYFPIMGIFSGKKLIQIYVNLAPAV